MFRKPIWSIIAAGILLSGCATTSEHAQKVDNLENELASLRSNTQVEQYAAVAVDDADKAVREARDLIDEGAEEELIDHQIYIADRKINIAEEMAVLNASQDVVKNAEIRRKDLLLGLRTREAQEMASRANQLEQELENLSTQETDRGLVIVPGNILFEFDSEQIKPGSERTLQKVAQFLIEYPERKIKIEGFTDNVGDEQYNRDLSQRRADSVKRALVNAGVPEDRITTEGLGEEFPVASNDTNAGRLENRRVEIIISPNGDSVVQRGQ